MSKSCQKQLTVIDINERRDLRILFQEISATQCSSRTWQVSGYKIGKKYKNIKSHFLKIFLGFFLYWYLLIRRLENSHRKSIKYWINGSNSDGNSNNNNKYDL